MGRCKSKNVVLYAIRAHPFQGTLFVVFALFFIFRSSSIRAVETCLTFGSNFLMTFFFGTLEDGTQTDGGGGRFG